VSSYYSFREQWSAPVRRREGPGADVVVILSFEDEWLIDGERRRSFVAGLHDRQVDTENAGRANGMQVNLSALAAYQLFSVPMYTLARRTVPLDDVWEAQLPEWLAEADDATRFMILDDFLAERLAKAPSSSREVRWAWERLCATHGTEPITALADELGWSRKRIVARFREEIGLAPKSAARLLRFDRARVLAERSARPDWARIAVDCGYYDQSHLIRDFRAVTGRTPETFFQDTLQTAA
jgi:AraC-like DNA-binding protein